MDKARVYQTYLAEKPRGRGVYARVGKIYGRSDEWARKIIKDYEQSGDVYHSVIRGFKPNELRYEPAPLELAYQKERDQVAKALRECQQQDLLCQLLEDNANCEDSASQSDRWQTDANSTIRYCQQYERKNIHCCEYAWNAKWYSCAACFGPGLGWSVLTMWGVSLIHISFITTCYRYPALCFVLAVPIGCWLALTFILTAAWLDTIFVAWRLWISIFVLIMFLVIAIGVGL